MNDDRQFLKELARALRDSRSDITDAINEYIDAGLPLDPDHLYPRYTTALIPDGSGMPAMEVRFDSQKGRFTYRMIQPWQDATVHSYRSSEPSPAKTLGGPL